MSGLQFDRFQSRYVQEGVFSSYMRHNNNIFQANIQIQFMYEKSVVTYLLFNTMFVFLPPPVFNECGAKLFIITACFISHASFTSVT